MDKKDIKYEFKGLNLSEKDKTWGQERFQDYIISYPHLNQNLGNAQLLEELVWAEIVLERIKQGVEDKVKKDGDKIISPQDKDYASLQTARAQVMALKKELGMFEEKKNQDVFEIIQGLQEKFAEERKRNPLAFKTTCPHCGKAYCLKRRTENYEEFISPFFEDKILNNKPLMELYHTGVITKEQAAKVLGVNPKFIDWLDKNVYHLKVEDDNQEPPAEESAPTNQ